MGRLLLVRHGESEWNAAGRWQGHADPPLSARGEQQALAAARSLVGIGRVASSDLRRAHTTATLIASALDLGEVSVVAALRERDVGEWSGLTNDDIDARFPNMRAQGQTPPSWEASAHFLGRVTDALVVLGEFDTDTLVISHGGVVRIVEDHLGAPAQACPNLAGRWLEVRGGGLHLGERVFLADNGAPGEPL